MKTIATRFRCFLSIAAAMLEDTDLELRALRAHHPAPSALREILNALQTSHFNVFYAIRSRVKPVKAILEKVRRKREEGRSDYGPEEITDIVGIRIVTLFREDVVDALKIFLRLIRHQGPAISPFSRNELKEGIIYTSTSIGDPEAIISRLRGVFDTYEFPITDGNIRQVQTGYSSVHLVAFCNVNQDGKAEKVPIEIQIRTVFEDAWGEIDHKLRYSINRGKISGSTGNLIESWKPHLNVLKTFADGCGQYAGIIKSQAIDAKPRFDGSPMVPVDSAEEALKKFGGCSAEVRSAFERAYSTRNEADRLAQSGDASAKRSFEEAAELFGKAETLAANDETPIQNSERQVAVFFARMEKAFCLLSTERKAAIDEAINIYSRAQDFSPNSSVVFYRYGQALAKLNEFDSAIAKYEKAVKLIATDQHIPEEHWIHKALPLRLGYAIWRKSLLCDCSINGGLEERLALLERAFSLTRETLSGNQTKDDGTLKISAIRATNNLLYYGVEYISVANSSIHRSINKDELLPYLQTLEDNVELGTAPIGQLGWIDTMCRAYCLLGKTDKAVLAAERIEHLLSAPRGADSESQVDPTEPPDGEQTYYTITDNLNDRERDILDHALWVLRKHGPGPERGNNAGHRPL